MQFSDYLSKNPCSTLAQGSPFIELTWLVAFSVGSDIDHRHPEVYQDFFHFGKWTVDEVGIAGFRLDAIKHIDETFMSNFISETRNNTNMSRLFAVGEFWKDECVPLHLTRLESIYLSGTRSLGELDEYLDTLGVQFSLFDVPLHYNFKEAGDRGASYNMAQIFDGTIVQRRPIDAV